MGIFVNCAVADLHTKVPPPPLGRTKFFRFDICFRGKAPMSEVGIQELGPIHTERQATTVKRQPSVTQI